LTEPEKKEYGRKIGNLLTDHLLINEIDTSSSTIVIYGVMFEYTTLEDMARALTSHGVKGSISTRGNEVEVRVKVQSVELAGTATINPAIGPDAPISIKLFLLTIGEFIFINAPNVPINEGAGIKYGNDAFTLFLFDAK